jgi:hypothetical protein
MNVFTFIFLVVTVSLLAGLLQTYLKQRHVKSDSADDIEQTLSKIDLLEERIQVLERIITESRFDLKSQIDRL